MKNASQILGIASAFVLAAGIGIIGCGEGDDDDQSGDGGRDASPTLYALKTGDYVVQSAKDVDDKCMIGVDKTTANMGLIGATIPLEMEMSGGVNTGVVNLGNPQGSPMQPSIGTGRISSNVGTLTSDTTITTPSPSMCVFRRQTTANLKMTGHYTFELEVTRTQSNAMMCSFPNNCTSKWTWVMSCPTCNTTGGGGSDAGR